MFSHRQAAVRAVTVEAVGHLVLVTQGGVFEDLVKILKIIALITMIINSG